jgi:hypothetical protein
MKNVEERPCADGHKERIHAVVKCDYCSTVVEPRCERKLKTFDTLYIWPCMEMTDQRLFVG